MSSPFSEKTDKVDWALSVDGPVLSCSMNPQCSSQGWVWSSSPILQMRKLEADCLRRPPEYHSCWLEAEFQPSSLTVKLNLYTTPCPSDDQPWATRPALGREGSAFSLTVWWCSAGRSASASWWPINRWGQWSSEWFIQGHTSQKS